MNRYRFIEAQCDDHPVRLLCQVVGVPTSGYYAWQQAKQQAQEQESPTWERGSRYNGILLANWFWSKNGYFRRHLNRFC